MIASQNFEEIIVGLKKKTFRGCNPWCRRSEQDLSSKSLSVNIKLGYANKIDLTPKALTLKRNKRALKAWFCVEAETLRLSAR